MNRVARELYDEPCRKDTVRGTTAIGLAFAPNIVRSPSYENPSRRTTPYPRLLVCSPPGTIQAMARTPEGPIQGLGNNSRGLENWTMKLLTIIGDDGTPLHPRPASPIPRSHFSAPSNESQIGKVNWMKIQRAVDVTDDVEVKLTVGRKRGGDGL